MQGHTYNQSSSHGLFTASAPVQPPQLVSPKPQLAQGNHISARTTKALEHQASVVYANKGILQRVLLDNNDIGSAPTAPAPVTSTMSNARVANWVASTSTSMSTQQRQGDIDQGQGLIQTQYAMMQPSQQPYYGQRQGTPVSAPAAVVGATTTSTSRHSSGGTTNNQTMMMPYPPSQLQQQQQQMPRVSIHSTNLLPPAAAPGIQSQHPPRSASMYAMSTPTNNNNNNQQQQYHQQPYGGANSSLGPPSHDISPYDRRSLHHSFSEMNLTSNGYGTAPGSSSTNIYTNSRLQSNINPYSGINSSNSKSASSSPAPMQQRPPLPSAPASAAISGSSMGGGPVSSAAAVNDPRYRTASGSYLPPAANPASSSSYSVNSSPRLSASTSRPLSSSMSGSIQPPISNDPNAMLANSMAPGGPLAQSTSSSSGTSITHLSSSNSSIAATLCIALPTQSELSTQREQASLASNPVAARVTWAKDVLKFVERHQACSSGGEYSKITDPILVKWTDESIRLILSAADNTNLSSSNPVPEALYLRGELSSSGKFPSYRSKDLSMAFRDFEQAANLGFHAAWAKIALAYEMYGEQNKSQADFDRAKRAYEEGVQKNEVTCLYRIAMAHLLGQLDISPNAAIALPMLRKAASVSTTDDPLPAYIYGMLLAGELDLGSNVTSSITPNLLLDEYGRTQEARPWIERSAYLGYAPAQFKMGFNYEYATMGCGYDPLLSVQYYSLASQQGDIEADMALSKWFLCGSEAFDLQENLAFTFAEKAAKKGLPSAEFALGYYYEIGIGGRKDLEASKIWYSKGAAHGNNDASDRLASLNSSAGNVLSRTEHEAQMNDKIVRRHTQAKMDTDTRRRKQGGSSSETPVAPLPPMPPMSPLISSAPQLNVELHQQQPSAPHHSAPTPAAARPPRLSSAQPQQHMGASAAHTSYTAQQHTGYGGDGHPVQFPPVMPTTDSNVSLRKRDTMRQVRQAAENSNRITPSGPVVNNSKINQGRPPSHTMPQRKDSGGGGGLAPPITDAAGIRRYSLVDSGPSMSSGASSALSHSHSSHSSGVQMVNKPAKGPQTFEAMGLQTGKVKADQECIIS